MKEKIVTTTQPFDENHYIIFFSIGGKDIGFSLHICEFNKEMEYLFYDCKVKVVNGKTDFIFQNTIPIDEVIFEMEKFIVQYNLDN